MSNNNQNNFSDNLNFVLGRRNATPTKELKKFSKELERLNQGRAANDQYTDKYIRDMIDEVLNFAGMTQAMKQDPKGYAKYILNRADMARSQYTGGTPVSNPQAGTTNPLQGMNMVPVLDQNGNVIGYQVVGSAATATQQFTPSDDPQDLYDMIVEYTDLMFGKNATINNGKRRIPYGKSVRQSSDKKMEELKSKIVETWDENFDYDYMQKFIEIIIKDSTFKDLRRSFARAFKMDIKSILELLQDMCDNIKDEERLELLIDLIDMYFSQNHYMEKLCKSIFNIDLCEMMEAIKGVLKSHNKNQNLSACAIQYIQSSSNMNSLEYINEKIDRATELFIDSISLRGDIYKTIMTAASMFNKSKEEKMVMMIKNFLDLLIDENVVYSNYISSDDNNYTHGGFAKHISSGFANKFLRY